MTAPTTTIVVPTIGRPSLTALLRSLNDSRGPRPARVIVVDDRSVPAPPLDDAVAVGGWVQPLVTVLASGGRGPAAARNVGWRAADTEWIAFLDDDVQVTGRWLADLAADLAAAADGVAGVQGRITVPLPEDRRPTDWERGTAGLADARWITADMAYRREMLRDVGGFDERFRRAFREDADLALRVCASGQSLAQGTRRTVHPVRRAPWHASLGQQRGNGDDVLMDRLHGRGWHRRADATIGRRPVHFATTAAAVLAGLGALAGRRRTAAGATAVWAASTAQFVWSRIAPGPRTPAECLRMAVTGVLIPPAAVVHWLRGQLAYRQVVAWQPVGSIDAVLVDRDGTIVHDVPYNGDPDAVRVVDDVPEGLRRLRSAGLRLGVITNQSGVARRIVDADQVQAVNARIDDLLGPFDTWQVCPHDDSDGCGCRKPRPGLVLEAAAALGVPVHRCAVVGDTGADVAAGDTAGVALSVLVPNGATRPAEIAAAPCQAASFTDAVDRILARTARR